MADYALADRGIYAGEFAVIVSVGDFDVPTQDRDTGQTSVIFGKCNIDLRDCSAVVRSHQPDS